LRIVFFGSPDFAVPALTAVARAHDIVAVVTQPDRPAGRGARLQPPPVKVRAAELGLPVMQPSKLRDGVVAQQLAGLAPDLFVVVAYGRILPPDLLAVPRLGPWNVHASLLPKYRGAAPIQWAGEICERVCLPMGLEPPLHRRRVDFWTKSRAFSIAKARRILGYEPQVDFEEGVARTVAAYRQVGWL